MTIKELLHLILDWQMIIIACCALIYFANKDRSAFLFTCVTLVSFLLSYLLTPYIFEYDPNRIFRYLFWISNDIAWMAIITYLGLKDKISLRLCISAQVCVIPAMLVQLLRIVDVQILNIQFISSLYQTIIPLSNSLVVLLCVWPLLFYLVEKAKLMVFKMSDAN